MCGICGYAGLPRDETLLRRMTDVITHRGPDDEGFFFHDSTGLGMRRLSIIDVAGGKQPIQNEDGTLAIVCNGEIYNYRALTEDLVRRGHRFTTKSDVEAVLHLYEEYGPACVEHLRGMYAFAIYDTRRRRLFLARDRLGIKPLYYWAEGGRLLFGSEIKAILECDAVPREPSLPAIDAYLSLRYVPGPETLFAGIRKLPAGHWLLWEDGQVRMERYWRPAFPGGPYRSDGEYRERFAELFTESVRMRLMSEVPLGSFLSGGVDSTAIVTAMSRLVDQPVQTFSVGFNWAGDELSAAQVVAERLGCDHHEVVCQPEDLGLLPKIIWHLDEPVGDAIVVPMFLLARLARRSVTVVHTGEGADEILAGYFFHKVMAWARRYARLTPGFLQRGLVQPAVRWAPARLLNLAFRYPADLGDAGRHKLLDYLTVVGRRDAPAEYRSLISLFGPREKAALYAGPLREHRDAWFQPGAGMEDWRPATAGARYLDEVLSLQYAHWLPDDILMKQDKMSMANSLEGRVPFMDHELVEFLMQTPPHLKLRGFTDKALLRGYLQDQLPGEPARRPKQAFYIPLDQYLTGGPLKEMVETCLSEESLRRRGYFAPEGVRALREAVSRREFLYGKRVLSLLALELWHRIFIDREPGWVG